MVSEATQSDIKTFADVYKIYGGKEVISTKEYQIAVKEFNQKDAVTNRERFDVEYAKDIVTVGGEVDRKVPGNSAIYGAIEQTNRNLKAIRSGVGLAMQEHLKNNGIDVTFASMVEAFPEKDFPANIEKFFKDPAFIAKVSDVNKVLRVGSTYTFNLTGEMDRAKTSYINSAKNPKVINKEEAEKKVNHGLRILEKLKEINDSFLPSQKITPESAVSYEPIIDLITRSYNYCLQIMGAPFTNNLFSRKTLTPEKKIALFGKQGVGFGSNVFTFIYAFEKKFGQEFIKNNVAAIKDLLSGDLSKFDFAPGNYRDTFNAIVKKYAGIIETTLEVKGGSVKFFDITGKNIFLELPKMFDNESFIVALSETLKELTGKNDIKFVKSGDSYVVKFGIKKKFVPESDNGKKVYDVLSGKIMASLYNPVTSSNESTASLEDVCMSLYMEQNDDESEDDLTDEEKYNLRKSAGIGYADKIEIVSQKGTPMGSSSSIILENLLDVVNFNISEMFDRFNAANNMKAEPEPFFLASSKGEAFFKFGGRDGEAKMVDVLNEVGRSGDKEFIANLNILIGN